MASFMYSSWIKFWLSTSEGGNSVDNQLADGLSLGFGERLAVTRSLIYDGMPMEEGEGSAGCA